MFEVISKKSGKKLPVTADQMALLISKGKYSASDFTEKQTVGDKPILTNNQEAYQEPKEIDSRVENLRGYYDGDYDKYIDAVSKGKRPIFSDDYGTKQEQQQFYNTVRAIINGGELPVNKYTDEVEKVGNLKNWVDTKDGEERSFASTLFPNLTLRQQDGSGSFSKAVGAVQDVATIPSRLATATVDQLTPRGESLSFSESFGRPEAYSSGGERMGDFMMSGLVGEGIVNLGAKSAGRVANLIGKSTPRSFEPARKIVQSVGSEAFVPRNKVIAQEAISGAKQSLLPSAFTATEDEQYGGGVGRGAAELIGGTALGAGLGAFKSYGRMRPQTSAGQELSGQITPFQRMYEARNTFPLETSAEGVEQLKNIEKSKSDILGKIGDKRDAGIEIIDQASPVIDVFGAERIKDSFLNNSNNIGENIAVDLTELLDKEKNRIIDNLQKQTNKNQMPSPKNIVDEARRIRKLADRTTDTDKKYMYQQLEKSLLDTENEAMQVIQKMDDIPEVAQAATDVMDSRSEFKKAYKSFEEIPFPKEDMATVKKAELFLRNAGRSRLDPTRRAKEFSQFQNIMNKVKNTLDDYDIKYTEDDIDFITPSVIREVQDKIKGEAGTAFGTVLSDLSKLATGRVPAMAISGAKKSAKALLSGRGAPQAVGYESQLLSSPSSVDSNDKWGDEWKNYVKEKKKDATARGLLAKSANEVN